MSEAALANWIAFAALLIMGGISALSFAFMLGKIATKVENHGHRLKALEDDGKAIDGQHSQLAQAVARLEGFIANEVKHLQDGMGEVKAILAGLGSRISRS